MTTVKAIEEKFLKHQKAGANTYMAPSKNMSEWLKDELLFVRKIEEGCVVVFRPMDGKLYSLNGEQLLNFNLL
tara:strand:+ start:240 stop:458 length:219 start_codon:yes stop_codon:yes gene_type:complete